MLPDIDELIKKFFNGECSAEEKIILNEWYHSFDNKPDPEVIRDENKRALYEKLMLDRINSNIRQVEKENEIVLPIRKNTVIRYLVYGFAGVAAMLLVYVGINLLRSPVVNVKSPSIIANQTITLENNTSKIQKYILSDGSAVWLSPASRVVALKNFEKDKRQLSLDGMAFFEVTKNKARPFIIKTSTLTTKVWGTSFTVNAYKNRRLAEVSVLTGKVSVTIAAHNKTVSSKNEVMLLPHQSASYTEQSAGLTTSTAVPDLRIWKKVNMYFDNAKMGDVIKALNQKFDVHIVAGDGKISEYSFIADLSEQNLPSILEILKTSLDVNYEINDDEITLRSNH